MKWHMYINYTNSTIKQVQLSPKIRNAPNAVASWHFTNILFHVGIAVNAVTSST